MKLMVFTCCITAILSHSTDEEDLSKRILASDPDYIHQLEAKLQELTAEVAELKGKYAQNINNKESSGVYTIWGKTMCPSTAELVYSGYLAGSWYDYTGSAANTLCLPPVPEWWPDAGTTSAAYVYGGEYEDNFHTSSHIDDYSAACSVCRTNRTSILMIPAKTSCYPGWTIEYSGHLAAGHHSHAAATEYICIDRYPESLKSHGLNHDGKEIYPVGVKCRSLPCPPYSDGGRLSCVVCSR